MCPVERRAKERAMHESFLVVKTHPGDVGSRPATGAFASPDITVGPDGRPRATIWNLGTREVHGVMTEFAAVAAGMPVTQANRHVIGVGNPANIPPNTCVTVTCNAVWRRMSHADVLQVTAFHPDLDPVKTAACDPLSDRHVGQFNYQWSGGFAGMCPGNQSVALQIRPANQGLYHVKVFLAVNGRIPTNPQVERTMAPNGFSFRWQQSHSARKEDWEITMVDNGRVAVRCKPRHTDPSAKTEPELAGILQRE